MEELRKNRSLWASESEFTNVKQILELMRSGALVLGHSVNGSGEPRSKDDSLCSLLVWLLYYYEHETRNRVNGWKDGSVLESAMEKDNVYCNGYEQYLEVAKNKIESLVGEFKLEDYPVTSEPKKTKTTKKFNPFSKR